MPIEPLPCADGGTGSAGPDVEQTLLCDLLPDGSIAGTALAVYQYDETGSPVGAPTFVDPATGLPYVATGILQPCPGDVGCGAPTQFCFESTAAVDQPGRMYDTVLTLGQGFAVQSLVKDLVETPLNIVWEVTDPTGVEFASTLQTAVQSQFPGQTVTVTPGAVDPCLGGTADFAVHIECLRIDQNPPTLLQLKYNSGRDLIINPAFLSAPNTGQFAFLKRQDAASGVTSGDVLCTNVAGKGWETNDVRNSFETWGPPGSNTNVAAATTPPPRGTVVQEINSYGSGAQTESPGFGNDPNTIWQTFTVPAAGNFTVRVVVGGRASVENIAIKLSTGDVDAAGIGDVINTSVNAGQVTTQGPTGSNTGTGTAGPWTTFNQTVPLAAGVYTLAFTGPPKPPGFGGNAFGGLFTDMRVFQDAPNTVENFATDDDTCTVPTTETSTVCEFWAPRCSEGQIAGWYNVADGQEMTNAAFWAQVPAPTCCTSMAGEGSSSVGNLVYTYAVCATLNGEQRTMQRVVVSDQTGGIIADSFIDTDGGPVTPDTWQPGECASSTTQTTTAELCDYGVGGGPDADGVFQTTRFLRTYTRDNNGTLLSTADTDLATGAPYVPAGVLGVGTCGKLDFEVVVFCDLGNLDPDGTPHLFLRDYQFNTESGSLFTTNARDLQTGDLYAPVGPIRPYPCGDPVFAGFVCDVFGGSPIIPAVAPTCPGGALAAPLNLTVGDGLTEGPAGTFTPTTNSDTLLSWNRSPDDDQHAICAVRFVNNPGTGDDPFWQLGGGFVDANGNGLFLDAVWITAIEAALGVGDVSDIPPGSTASAPVGGTTVTITFDGPSTHSQMFGGNGAFFVREQDGDGLAAGVRLDFDPPIRSFQIFANVTTPSPGGISGVQESRATPGTAALPAQPAGVFEIKQFRAPDGTSFYENLDGTAHTVLGTVGECGTFFQEQLCDAPTSVQFLRVYKVTGGTVSDFQDYDLAGAPYAVAGTAGRCETEVADLRLVESKILCYTAADTTVTEFLRRYLMDQDGVSVIAVLDTLLDGVTPFVTVVGGTVALCGETSACGQSIGTICYTPPPTTIPGQAFTDNWIGSTVLGANGGPQTITNPDFGPGAGPVVWTSAKSNGIFATSSILITDVGNPNGTFHQQINLGAPRLNVTLLLSSFNRPTLGVGDAYRNISPAFTSVTGQATAVLGNTGVDGLAAAPGQATLHFAGPVQFIDMDYLKTDSQSGTVVGTVSFDTAAVVIDADHGTAAVIRDCETGVLTYVDLVTGDPVDFTAITVVDCVTSGDTSTETPDALALCDITQVPSLNGARSALNLTTLANGPTAGAFANGITFTVDQGVPGASGTYLINGSSTQTWTFSQPAMLRFGVNNLNVGAECVTLPVGTVVESVHANHTYNAGTRVLCNGGAAAVTDESIFTLAAATSLAIVSNPGGGGQRGLVRLEAGLTTFTEVRTPFLRTICRTCGAAPVVTDTTMDAATPYVPVGTVGVCDVPFAPVTAAAAARDVEMQVLCDATPTRFLRRYTYDAATGALVSIVNTTLDGSTAFAPVGAVGVCTTAIASDFDFLSTVLCDANGTQFIQRLTFNSSTGAVTATTNTTLTGAAFAPVAPVALCSSCCPVVMGEGCTNVGSLRYTALRLANGTVSLVDSVTGATVLPANIVACAPPNGVLPISVNSQHRLVAPGAPWTPGADVVGALLSVTYVVLTGTASVADSNGTVANPLPAGLSATWSLNDDRESLAGPTNITANAASSVYVAWTQR